MNAIYQCTYQSPVGPMILGACNEQLCLCDWPQSLRHVSNKQRIQQYFKGEFIPGNTELLQEAIRQLDAYFSSQRNCFDLPIRLVGTEFQNQVWQMLSEIPHGKTLSYKELALRLGHPMAVRAVASAVGANPLSVIIPCHRIIGSNGQPIGYAGGLRIKQQLLELECKSTTLF